jgi:hypothetical protein
MLDRPPPLELDRSGAPPGLRRLRPVVRPGEEPPDRGRRWSEEGLKPD